MTAENFKFFTNRLARIVFIDGDHPCAKVGKVISVDEAFLVFQTYHNRYVIRLDQILKIQLAEAQK